MALCCISELPATRLRSSACGDAYGRFLYRSIQRPTRIVFRPPPAHVQHELLQLLVGQVMPWARALTQFRMMKGKVRRKFGRDLTQGLVP